MSRGHFLATHQRASNRPDQRCLVMIATPDGAINATTGLGSADNQAGHSPGCIMSAGESPTRTVLIPRPFTSLDGPLARMNKPQRARRSREPCAFCARKYDEAARKCQEHSTP